MSQGLPPLSPCSETSLPSPSESTSLKTPREEFSNNLYLISVKQRLILLSESQINAPLSSEDSPILSFSQSSSAPCSHNFTSFPYAPQTTVHPSVSSFRRGLYSGGSSETFPSQQGDPSQNPTPLPGIHALSQTESCSLNACSYSYHFPHTHYLNPAFVNMYRLGDELGHGAFGFVMTALHRTGRFEVAVKFIIKRKIPEAAWVHDDVMGRVPIEVMLLSRLDHENIVKCYDVFEDELYFYLVQELHGSPWPKAGKEARAHSITSPPVTCRSLPALSPRSTSTNSLSDPAIPTSLRAHKYSDPVISRFRPPSVEIIDAGQQEYLAASVLGGDKPWLPKCYRRPSYDLFECIEQSPLKRFNEDQARYIFSQVIGVVHYLNQRGITHRDIKDENLVIDKDLCVKFIDFGSAIIVDPTQPRPFHTHFYGTTAYAAPEVLRHQPYQAEPAEIWTLGVLLSFLLTGMSPFASRQGILAGRMIFGVQVGLSETCIDLFKRCLEPDPTKRADIEEVRRHPWVLGKR